MKNKMNKRIKIMLYSLGTIFLLSGGVFAFLKYQEHMKATEANGTWVGEHSVITIKDTKATFKGENGEFEFDVMQKNHKMAEKSSHGKGYNDIFKYTIEKGKLTLDPNTNYSSTYKREN